MIDYKSCKYTVDKRHVFSFWLYLPLANPFTLPFSCHTSPHQPSLPFPYVASPTLFIPPPVPLQPSLLLVSLPSSSFSSIIVCCSFNLSPSLTLSTILYPTICCPFKLPFYPPSVVPSPQPTRYSP